MSKLTHKVSFTYQIGEDEGEWNYVKMTEDFDVLIETTCFVDDSCLPNSAK